MDRRITLSGMQKDEIMQKPNTVFAKRRTAPAAHAGKTAQAHRNEADKNARHALKK